MEQYLAQQPGVGGGDGGSGDTNAGSDRSQTNPDSGAGGAGGDAPMDGEQLKLPKGVTAGVIVLESVGPALEAGLTFNDVIVKLDDRPVSTTMELRKYLYEAKKIGDKIEALEDELVTNPDDKTLRQIYALKREMISLRRSIWPLRELVNGMQRSESALLSEPTGIYLRDVYDHTVQIIDTIESFRDIVAGMLDTYLSSISNRMNGVMKVLTIIATLFIPLTFVAGIYGMNFEHMPELKWRYGYAAVWAVMLVVGAAMLVYFRRKKWL